MCLLDPLQILLSLSHETATFEMLHLCIQKQPKQPGGLLTFSGESAAGQHAIIGFPLRRNWSYQKRAGSVRQNHPLAPYIYIYIFLLFCFSRYFCPDFVAPRHAFFVLCAARSTKLADTVLWVSGTSWGYLFAHFVAWYLQKLVLSERL